MNVITRAERDALRELPAHSLEVRHVRGAPLPARCHRVSQGGAVGRAAGRWCRREQPGADFHAKRRNGGELLPDESISSIACAFVSPGRRNCSV